MDEPSLSIATCAQVTPLNLFLDVFVNKECIAICNCIYNQKEMCIDFVIITEHNTFKKVAVIDLFISIRICRLYND